MKLVISTLLIAVAVLVGVLFLPRKGPPTQGKQVVSVEASVWKQPQAAVSSTEKPQGVSPPVRAPRMGDKAPLGVENDSSRGSEVQFSAQETGQPGASEQKQKAVAQQPPPAEFRQPDPEVRRASREEQRARFRAHFDQLLQSESPDPEWQKTLHAQAATALEQVPVLQGVIVSETLCGETLCRMTLTANDVEAYRQLRGMRAGIEILLGSEAWTLPDPEELVFQVYISRPGASLPLDTLN